MLTQILYGAGMDPSAVIGGKLRAIGGYGRAGQSDLFVYEACEFKDTFLATYPDLAVVLNIDNDHLDYFGTVEGQRGAGLGSQMLKLLSEFYKDYRGIFGEAEAVTSSDPEEAALQKRRLGFYERNGLRYAGYDCALFGVHFHTLILDRGENTPEEILAAHQRIYRGGLPAAAYERFIQIPLREGEAVRPATDWVEE